MKVKDLRITLQRRTYVATVEYYQDVPSRDHDVPAVAHFQTLKEAQKWLATFAPDVWCGNEHVANRKPLL